MNIEKILNQIGEIYSPLSNDCLQEFVSKSKLITYRKGDTVVKEGQYSKKAYLIIIGCANDGVL